jgi:hypothetical protein
MSNMGKSATDAGTKALTNAAVQSMVPTTGMSVPGNVPSMPINDDTMAMLQKLMEQSKNKGQLV